MSDFDVDARPPSDFGVMKVGTFNYTGGIDDWHLDQAVLADDLPRWMLNEPPFRAGFDPPHVYLRGVYSEKLSRERRKALGRRQD